MRIPRWRQEGQHPDYRFSLANERTFLAWIRTAMGLLAGGILLDQFSTRLAAVHVITALAVTLALLASALGSMAYLRWRAIEIAMRKSAPLPSSLALPMVALATGFIGVIIACFLVTRP